MGLDVEVSVFQSQLRLLREDLDGAIIPDQLVRELETAFHSWIDQKHRTKLDQAYLGGLTLRCVLRLLLFQRLDPLGCLLLSNVGRHTVDIGESLSTVCKVRE